MNNGFREVIKYLPSDLADLLGRLPENTASEIYEIRLRASRPVIIFGETGVMFLKPDGSVCRFYNSDCICAEQSEILQTVNRLCGYSVYSHQNDIAQGFLTFGDGHRAGFSGTAVVQDGKIAAIRNIDGINIRVSKKINIENDSLTQLLESEDMNGLVICGPPCSGKTTLLRNIAEKYSSLYSAGYKKTVVVDERFELGNINGLNCDILRGFGKYDGIVYATRVLSPEIVVCDEICDQKEADEIVKCCYSGIKFVLSLYSDSAKNLLNRAVGKILIKSGFFSHIIFLDSKNKCKKFKIIKTEDLLNEFCSNNSGFV